MAGSWGADAKALERAAKALDAVELPYEGEHHVSRCKYSAHCRCKELGVRCIPACNLLHLYHRKESIPVFAVLQELPRVQGEEYGLSEPHEGPAHFPTGEESQPGTVLQLVLVPCW